MKYIYSVLADFIITTHFAVVHWHPLVALLLFHLPVSDDEVDKLADHQDAVANLALGQRSHFIVTSGALRGNGGFTHNTTM